MLFADYRHAIAVLTDDALCHARRLIALADSLFVDASTIFRHATMPLRDAFRHDIITPVYAAISPHSICRADVYDAYAPFSPLYYAAAAMPSLCRRYAHA